MKRQRLIALVASVTGLAACSDYTGPRTLENTVGVIVSAPVRLGAATAAAASRASGAAASGEQLVYVSLPPGSVPTGTWATIRELATRLSTTTAVVDGGFDPVSIAASVGDTLTIEITGSGAPVAAQVVVAAVRPLKIVRTSPPSGGRDVPLNAIIVVVFSEPIAPSTVDTTTVGLTTGTTRVPGSVALSSDGLRVSFTPDSLLLPNQSYVLSLGSGITSVDNQSFAAAQASFTTGAAPTSGLTALALYGGLNQTVEPGGSFQLHAVERDAAGHVVLNVPATFSLLHPATDVTTSVTPDGLVTGLVLGTDTIVATTTEGLSGRVAVAVVASGGIPFIGTWDVVQNVGGTCWSGSFRIQQPLNTPWVASNISFGCGAPIGAPIASCCAFQTALGQMDSLTLFSEATEAPRTCEWTGTYVSAPEPHIAGTVVQRDTGNPASYGQFCGNGGQSGTWAATPPMPVAGLTAVPQQATCAVGTTSVASVSMQNILGNRVGRYPLQVTSDNPGVAGQDTNWVSNNGAIAVAGTLPILCKAVGQTQLHITQDLATATITVTVTP